VSATSTVQSLRATLPSDSPVEGIRPLGGRLVATTPVHTAIATGDLPKRLTPERRSRRWRLFLRPWGAMRARWLASTEQLYSTRTCFRRDGAGRLGDGTARVLGVRHPGVHRALLVNTRRGCVFADCRPPAPPIRPRPPSTYGALATATGAADGAGAGPHESVRTGRATSVASGARATLACAGRPLRRPFPPVKSDEATVSRESGVSRQLQAAVAAPVLAKPPGAGRPAPSRTHVADHH